LSLNNYYSSINSDIDFLLPDVTWFGQKVYHYVGPIEELTNHIPHFERMPFSFGEFENIYSDIIYSSPINSRGPISIATVSKKYSLIQHHDLIKTFQEGMSITDMGARWNEAELTLSEYGERMRLSITLPGFDYDPGDGCPILLRINCLNSVDKSTSLEINFSWFRQVCSNGMIYGLGKSSFRKVHLYSHTSEEVAEYINKQISKISDDRGLFKKLLSHNVTLDQFYRWADDCLANSWGSHAAARACSIATSGYDGKIIDKGIKCPSSQKLVSQDEEVPGAFSPVDNAYHVSQVLSWIARSRKTIQDQMEKMMDIPNLIDELIEKYAA